MVTQLNIDEALLQEAIELDEDKAPVAVEKKALRSYTYIQYRK